MKNSKITIVGKTQARLGFSFVHKGASSKCAECRYQKVCIENLEPNRVYEVVGIRDREVPCLIHERGAQVVEVKEAIIQTTIPSRSAYEGAVLTFKPKECSKIECENYELCHPQGIKEGDKCKIVKIKEKKIECPQTVERILAIALLQRTPH